MDICLYISDQHAYEIQGFAGHSTVRTPNLDRIAKEGTVFDNAYTAYPVCVPARMSMMTGKYASNCGVMSNATSLSSNLATFVHCLDLAEYETVLCGRMHFVGADQRHGFMKRIAGDITQIYPNRPARISVERGVHDKTPQGGPGSVSLIGGGSSPTLEYDRYVIANALDYLKGSYEKPQFITVGTYAPHHPFVAPQELFEYYYDKVDVPEESFAYPEHPALRYSFRDTDRDVIRAVRAAYCGMVEFEDRMIGQVYDAFNDYLERTGREGIFVYVSDHGEMEGYRGYFGKNTFYESSVHIPMIWAGTGIKKGFRKTGPVSLMDTGPTILDLAGAQPLADADGISLKKQLTSEYDDTERTVVSEVGGNISMNAFSYGQMARKGSFKLIHYDGYDHDDILYDLDHDPEESCNVIQAYPEIADELRTALCQDIIKKPDELERDAWIIKKNNDILKKCEFDSDELWHCPPAGRELPRPLFKSQKTVQTWLDEIRRQKEDE